MKRITKLHMIPGLLYQATLRPITWLALRFFCHLKVEGLEHIEKLDGNFILATNHIHELDGYIVPAAIPVTTYAKAFYPVSREKGFYRDKGLRGLLYGGIFFAMMGAFKAYVGQNDYRKALRNQISILQNGGSVYIFPQGKVTDSQKRTLSPKGGVAFLSQFTGKPVVPAMVSGIEGMSIIDFLLRKKTMKITIRKPLYQKDMFVDTESVKLDDYKNGAKKVMKSVYNMK